MLTDQDISALLAEPKIILDKTPVHGYAEIFSHRRCDVNLRAQSDDRMRFAVFVRQHTTFIENFSIGLRFETGDSGLRTITLFRYNGPHGETSASPDGHFAVPHIHRLTAAELSRRSTQPQENSRTITNRYELFEQALR